ncbi:MAG: protein kinase domain-containing protein [Gemmataceae bacterium]
MAVVDSVDTFVEKLRGSPFLERSQLEELNGLQTQFDNPRALARVLLEREWLTPYQVNMLFQDRWDELMLGPYIILARLGTGVMGQVYKAKHQHMKRVVALKVIRPELLAEPAAVDRFYHEVQAASQLSHINIVHAYDAGPIDQTHFFAMEFVEGQTLERLVQEAGPLPVELAVYFISQTAWGLQHAFERGLLHRDLKPANLLVTRSSDSESDGDSSSDKRTGIPNLIKILNLGLTLLQPLPKRSVANNFNWNSPEGMQLAPDYIAPERTEGDPGDIRSDLYSLGGVFYFLLTGQVPFPGGDSLSKLRRHREENPVPIELHRADVPEPVGELIRRLLAKNPDERPATPAEVALHLEALFPPAPPPTAAPQPVTSEQMFAAVLQSDPTHDTLTMAAKSGAATTPIPLQGLNKKRQRLLLAAGGAALFLIVFVLAALFSKKSDTPTATTTASISAADQAQEKLRGFALQLRDGTAAPKELERELLAFQREQAGTVFALRAAHLRTRLPSSLEQLDGRSIPSDHLPTPRVPQLMAMLGDPRGKPGTAIHSMVLTPDRQLVISGGQDGRMHVWSVADLSPHEVFSNHTNTINDLAISPDGQLLASGSMDHHIVLYDLSKSFQELRRWRAPHQIHALVFSPDGKQLISGDNNKTIRFWNVADGKEDTTTEPLTGHDGPIRSLALTKDGQLLASAGGQDKVIRLWQRQGEKYVAGAVLKGHDQVIQALAFTTDQRLLVSAANDQSIRLWDVTKPATPLVNLDKLGSNPISLAFTPDGGSVAASLANGRIIICDLVKDKLHKRADWKSSGSIVRALVFADQGERLLSAGDERLIQVWDTTARPPQEMLRRDATMNFQTVAFAPDGQTLACGNDAAEEIWIAEFGQAKPRWLHQFKGHKGAVHALVYSLNGRWLVSGGADKTVRMWNVMVSPPNLHAEFTGPDPIQALALNADDSLLAVGYQNGAVHVWDLRGTQPKELVKLEGSDKFQSIQGLRFHPTMPTRLAALAQDGRIKVWNLAGLLAQGLFHFPGVKPPVRGQALAFCQEGRWLVSGGNENVIRVWELPAGSRQPQEHQPLLNIPFPVMQLEASADNRTLVIGSQSGQLTLWDLNDNRLRRQIPLPLNMHCLALAPDGRHVAVVSNTGVVYLLRVADLAGRG